MNYHQIRTLRGATQATPYVLKCVFIVLLILFLSYATIPSAPHLVQRQRTITGHKTIHNIDTGSTSSTLTKAMKVLLHHFPARQEIPSTVPGHCHQPPHNHAPWKQCTSKSVAGVSQSNGDVKSPCYEPQTPRVNFRRSEGVNDASVCGLTLPSKNVQQRKNDHEIYYDGTGHQKSDSRYDVQTAEKKEADNTPPEKQAPRPIKFCSTQAWFCKYCPELCQEKGLPANNGYDGPEGTIESTVISIGLQHQPCENLWETPCNNLIVKLGRDEPSTRSEIDSTKEHDHERLVGGLRPAQCTCSHLNPNSRFPHYRIPAVEHIPTDMKRESLAASDIRNLDIFRNPADHESNEKELKNQLGARFETEDDEDDEDEDEEHGIEEHTGSPKPGTCPCDPNHPERHCPQHLALQVRHVQANKRRDVSSLPNIKGPQVSPDLEGGNPCKRGEYDESQGCQCPMCTGAISDWKQRSTLSDLRDLADYQKLADVLAIVTPKYSCSPKSTKCPCQDQKCHIVIHEIQNNPTTALAHPSGVKAGQNSGLKGSSDGDIGFETSEHIIEVDADTKRSPDGLDLTVPEHISIKRSTPTESIVVTRRTLRSNKWWCRRRYCQLKPSHTTQAKSYDHVAVEPEPLSDTVIAIRGRPCHKVRMVNSTCRRTHSDTPKLKTVPVPDHPVLRRNNTLLDSITHARCHDKEGTDREACENNNTTGFWVVCSLLIVVGICGVLLVLLTLLTRLRRKRPVPLLLNSELEHKNGASTPSTSVSEVQLPRVGRPPCVMRRIDEDMDDETGSVRHYTTLDGATDRWTKRIFQKQKRGKMVCQRQPGRFSPTPITRAPRIPTLKLPQPTLATMRKVSGLGSELEGALRTSRAGTVRGKDNTRIKWGSTV